MALQLPDARLLAELLAGRRLCAASIVREIEAAGLLAASEPPPRLPSIGGSHHLARVFRQHMDREGLSWHVEHLLLFLLDAQNQLLEILEIARGGLSGVSVHPREIMRPVLAHPRAAAFILAHNHPSGLLSASEADRHLTEHVRQAGEMLGIACLDHVIVLEHGDGRSVVHG